MNFKIGKDELGKNCPVYVIAEGCDNHMGDLEVAKEMALNAKLACCNAIKFQHHLPYEEMLPDVPMSDNFDIPLYDFLLKNALTLEQHKELKKYCDSVGITYMCTPFSLKAALEINELVDAFKIGSGEMTDIPSLKRIAELGKPMIISTGMSTFEEIDRTYNALKGYGIPIALMNCVSEYPPKYEDINLGVIAQMKERYSEALIGHSDHTPDLYTTYAAVALGAKIIEKHVILSKLTPGPDQAVSIEFDELKALVDGTRKIELANNAVKTIHDKEKDIRSWAFRSIVSTTEIKAGTVITQEMIWSKRPGTGIPSYRMDEVIGKIAVCDIKENTLVMWENLK